MDNYTIADNFSLLSKLMDIHGENSFKAKSFASAAFTIEKLTVQLKDTPRDEIFRIKGIGESTGKSILEMLDTQHFTLLEHYLQITPPGILEIMKIKGLGPKKIATIWKELEIESMGELLYACNENRLLLLKGFGQKTQESVRQNIEFYLSNRNRFLYAEVAVTGIQLEKQLQELMAPAAVSITGAFRRNSIIIDEIEVLIAAPVAIVQQQLAALPGFALTETLDKHLVWKLDEKVKVVTHTCAPADFFSELFITTAAPAFMDKFNAAGGAAHLKAAASEEAIFSAAGMDYIVPALREGQNEIEQARLHQLPTLITAADIKGIIHSHSQWSDGEYSLEDMAVAAKNQGFEYLVISDHSRSAFYANGLQPERVAAQQVQIDELNKKLAPFRIFKSIEADILNDGSLDYPDEILATFDLVIASVHSNLKMMEEKAMSRLLKAIENPYTTILGHMTGRLLLSRNGYPVDHKTIIDACAANGVVIELNAHPRRLDIDWTWLPYALEKNVLISIDPDAHSIEGFHDIHYGTLAAQKGGVTKANNLSSYTVDMLDSWLQQRKKSKNILL
ncbi:DNA polymerase/3'-5' exonuclease PolX [Chitinophaga nivalis]|uniref:Helix-hairpin-helix domain-containing protein n=1 Tax=Chitinophaga nivalis TaxID=2991709 RepID=A0ABT3IRF7_9BACT|nr:DNA polymerase/3'-5' exonuclease PolX [Chitinophaga nivalis]MCW3463766.1 helix-hairpin-helix domain-containing protein [Chitinophaga nivalis]MCW3486544.1 helix-hairpin-helix domain-containing protein [Chitinophaga nivalis]